MGAKTRNRFLYILYQPYKWLFFMPLFLMGTCVFVFLGVIIAFLTNDRIAHKTTGVWWSRFSAFFTPIAVDVIGRENIDRNRSYMVVANHQSNYDILVLYGWLGIDIKWVMKMELRKVPVFGFAGEAGGNIYIDRSSPEALKDTLETTKRKLVNGTSIVMLPEGTRSRNGEIGMFKRGAFVISRELDLPILPITICNSREILPPGTLDLYPGRITMKIHEPVDIGKFPGDDIETLIEHVRSVIKNGLEDSK